MGDDRQAPSNETGASRPAARRVTPLTRSEWGLLLVLGAVQFTHIVDFMIIMPLFAPLNREMGLRPSEFSLIVSVYGFSAGISTLLAAFFLDRWDRKSVLLLVYSGFTAGTLLCAVAPTYLLLLAARTITGAFGGVGAAMTLAIVGDAFPGARRGRAMGVVMSAFSVASIAGIPGGIGLAELLGWRAPFAVLGALSLGVLASGRILLPSLRGHLSRAPAKNQPGFWAVLTEPTHLRPYLLMIALVMSTLLIHPFLIGYLEFNVGRPAREMVWVYICGGGATIWTTNYIGRLSDRFGKLPVFRVLALFTIIPILLLTNLPPVPLGVALSVTTLFFIASSGRMVPAVAMITASTAARTRGSFMNVNSSVQQITMGLAALISGAIIGITPLAPLTDSGIAGAGAALALAASLQPEGPLTGFAIVGALSTMGAVVSVILAGRLRVAAGGLESVVHLNGTDDEKPQAVTGDFAEVF